MSVATDMSCDTDMRSRTGAQRWCSERSWCKTSDLVFGTSPPETYLYLDKSRLSAEPRRNALMKLSGYTRRAGSSSLSLGGSPTVSHRRRKCWRRKSESKSRDMPRTAGRRASLETSDHNHPRSAVHRFLRNQHLAIDSPRTGAKESLGATRHADRISSHRAISGPAFPRPASSR